MEQRKKNTGLYIFDVILCVLVLALGGYILYDKILTNKDTTTEKEDNQTNSNPSVSKLDNTKDWVYDAEYPKNITVDSYSTLEKTFYANDIVVPYINVNSSYAKTANNEIKEVLNRAIQSYNEGANGGIKYVDQCVYRKYFTDNNLSVVLTYGVGSTDVVHPEYYTYNVNLKDGNQLSYEEVYKLAGLNSSTIDSQVESAITKVMQDKLKDFKDPQTDTGDGAYYPDGTNFDTYNNESISNYKNSVSSNTLKYFLSSDGKLNIIVQLNIPTGTGEVDTIITVAS